MIFFPPLPSGKKEKTFVYNPIALFSAFIAGFSETSSVSFLAGYSISMGYALAAGAILVSTFGLSGTILPLPIGFFADKTSYTAGQLLCGITILGAAATIPSTLDFPLLTAFVIFLWGGIIGGMNTLAVIGRAT